MAVNWSDPCARYAALQAAYFNLISGNAESLIRHSTTEGDQEVRYARADMPALKAAMEAAEVECAVQQGTELPSRAKRFAIRGGSRRRRRPFLPDNGCL